MRGEGKPVGCDSNQDLHRESRLEKLCLRSGCTSLSLDEMAETMEREGETSVARRCHPLRFVLGSLFCWGCKETPGNFKHLKPGLPRILYIFIYCYIIIHIDGSAVSRWDSQAPLGHHHAELGPIDSPRAGSCASTSCISRSHLPN